MLHADVRQDFVRFLMGAIDTLDAAHVDAELAALDARACEVLACEGFEPGEVRLHRELDLHYPGQLWSIRVALPDGRFDAVRIRDDFEAEYRRLYGHIQPEGAIHSSCARVTASASTGAIAVAKSMAPIFRSARPARRRL